MSPNALAGSDILDEVDEETGDERGSEPVPAHPAEYPAKFGVHGFPFPELLGTD